MGTRRSAYPLTSRVGGKPIRIKHGRKIWRGFDHRLLKKLYQEDKRLERGRWVGGQMAVIARREGCAESEVLHRFKRSAEAARAK